MAYHNIADNTRVYPQGPYGWPQGIDNDQGAIRDGGTIAESTLWSSTSLGEGNPITTIASGVNNTRATKTDGAIWNNQPGEIIVRATTDIAGLSSTVVEGGASNSANESDSIHQLAVIRTRMIKTAIRSQYWQIFSGIFSPAPELNTEGAWDIAVGEEVGPYMKSSGTDIAANPSSARPGKLTYMIGNPVATNDSYKPRYNW